MLGCGVMFGGEVGEREGSRVRVIRNKEGVEVKEDSKKKEEVYGDEEVIVWRGEDENDWKE